MERIIGIDLGTTNSLSATVFEQGPEVIGVEDDSSITPSVLSWTASGWLGKMRRNVESPIQNIQCIPSNG